jgi:hypothetical protein
MGVLHGDARRRSLGALALLTGVQMQIPVNHVDWQLLLRGASLHCASGH